jgi:hypothetical protein
MIQKLGRFQELLTEVSPRFCNRDPVKMLSYNNSEFGINLAVVITLQALKGKYGLILTMFEKCTFLGYYKASSGNFLPLFWDNLLVPPSRLKNPKQSL